MSWLAAHARVASSTAYSNSASSIIRPCGKMGRKASSISSISAASSAHKGAAWALIGGNQVVEGLGYGRGHENNCMVRGGYLDGNEVEVE